MIKRVTLALASSACVATLAASAKLDHGEMAYLAKAKPDVRWDPTTQTAADFDADGKDDFAVVGYIGDGLVLAIRSSHNATRDNFQYLGFGINGTEQDAICKAPAHLSVVPLICDTGGGALRGCRQSRRAFGLTLSDANDDCDSINLYWDHDHHRMAWWRN